MRPADEGATPAAAQIGGRITGCRSVIERIAGTWSDGKGGTLVLTPDGKSVATRVHTFDFDGSLVHCSGTGSWVYHPGAEVWSQEVEVSIVGCAMDTWEILGTSAHPKLYVFVGDPDSWDLYKLQRRDLHGRTLGTADLRQWPASPLTGVEGIQHRA